MEQKNNKERAQWGSRIGFMLAAVGSAVGLGNIWKFPGRAFEGGGAAYIIIYIVIVAIMGVPLILTELSLGRTGKANVLDSFKKFDSRFSWVGWLGIIVPFIIVAYYAHVGGWVLKYIFGYIFESDAIFADPTGYFYGMLGFNLAGESWMPWGTLAFVALFFLICGFITLKGISKGIEKFNKIGMPALFVLLIVLLINSITLPGSGEGFNYLIHADWSKVTGATVLSALGQAFYSLSIGMGIMVTYGSFLKKEENIPNSSLLICSTDTLVALIAGFMVIPACFATIGPDKIGKGGGFAFMSLAGLFSKIPFGAAAGALFYLLLLFAAITSCISLFEVIVAFLPEHWGFNRKKSSIITFVILFLIGSLYTCSQGAFPIKGIWFDLANGLTFPTFGDFMEWLPDRLLMPLCALGISIYVGWVRTPQAIVDEVKQSSKFSWHRIYQFLIKYVSPIGIMAIMIYSFVTGTSIS